MKIVSRDRESKKWRLAESVVYSAEEELQRILAESPSLIPMSEIRPDTNPLVVAIREFGLPGSGSTDILAFSPEGDIAVVECKLDANPEIKRKVVGQILEYGAYLWGMSYDELDEQVYARTQKHLTELIAQVIDNENWNEEDFREIVTESLKKGDFILIIAVDEANDELKRIISFLNECGSHTFTFCALSVKRFETSHTEILVPTVYGPSLKASDRGDRRKKWNEESFFESVDRNLTPNTVQVIRDLYDWSKATADNVSFGVGKETGSFTFQYLPEGRLVSVFWVSTNGFIALNYRFLYDQISMDTLNAFHDDISRIQTFSHVQRDFKRFPSVSIESAFCNNKQTVAEFKEVVCKLRSNI